MLGQLVDEGFVARSDDPVDRRKIYYALTESGLALVDAALDERVEFLCGKLDRLGDSEKSRFANALITVLATTEKLRGVS
jgi:DNA-binding MarR family transcriptional regulator